MVKELSQGVVFTERERDVLYDVIFNRRDTRNEFLPDAIDDDVLLRILKAAHHAPSVGFMQPWDFVVIQSPDVKAEVKNIFLEADAEAAEQFEGDRKATYGRLKLEGIEEAPINICVTCDRDRCGPVVLGRTHMPEMDLYSSVCAVQNLWLAARAENIGLGWVSILKPEQLKTVLKLPDRVVPIAYLCLGKVKGFYEKPELQEKGWRDRMNLEDLIHRDTWGA